MTYRLIQITYSAMSRITTFDGWMAEETADQKFNEVAGESKTKYVILMYKGSDDQWYVRAEKRYGADS